MTDYTRISLESTVNTLATGSQYLPVAAGFAGGGFIVTWLTSDTTQDGSGTAIKAQRYDANGTKLGGEFLVNTSGVGNQTAQSVTTLPGGGFVITWQTSDTTQDGSGSAIKAQIFDANGVKVGSEFLVETNTTANQTAPSIASLSDGSFIIGWGTSDSTQDGAGSAVKAQRYSATGTPVGSEFLLNSTPSPGSEGRVSIAALSSGGFVATYTVGSGALADVYARVFDASGNALGASFIASAATQYYQDYCTAVQLTGGNVLLTWASVIDASGTIQQRGQVISATGTKIGAEFTLAGTAGMGDAKVVALQDGGFAAVWTPGTQMAHTGNTLLRYFNADGSARGEAEVMNSGTNSFEGYSALAIDGTGNLFASWMSTNGSDDNISAQILVAHSGPAITSNGGAGIAYVNAAENQQSVTTVVATNPNGAAQLTYAIVGGGDAARFAINATTGVLTFITAPNYESPTSTTGQSLYFVTVRASDGTFSDIQQLAVTVTNVNEAPNWGFYAGNYNVQEGATTVGTFTATDYEGNPVTYSLAGADAGLFAINSSTGAVSFVAAPNFEAPADADGNNVYALTLVASDGSLSSSKSLTVTVTNVNEAPVITSNGAGASAAVSVEENSAAVTTVQATDPEGTARTYSIAGGTDAALFTIDSASGALSFVAAPNFEAPTDSNGDNVYQVIVRASDGSLSDTQTLTVTVTNANEAPVIVSGPAMAIAEGASAAGTVTAADPDGTSCIYSIVGGADAALFAIDPASGALSFLSPPDFEAPADAGGNNVYDVIVQASDGTLATTQAVSVTVSNLNEAPTLADPGALSVAENTSSVATLVASDQDGDAISFAIVGGADAALFAIDAATGALSLVSAPDYEVAADANGDNVYELVVRASDGSLSSDRAIAVIVENTDEAPVIVSAGTFAASENDTAVGTVSAADPELVPVEYEILGGDDAGQFSIDPFTGVLSFNQLPDHEAPGDSDQDNVYMLVVGAWDGANWASQTIAVTVGNINEGPQITSNGGGDNASVVVTENGTAVTTVTASDPEGQPRTYSIVGGSDAARFTIDAATGALAFIAAPDFEAPGDADADNVYTVVVQASDGSLADIQVLNVFVANANEAPVITSGGGGASAAYAVSENGLTVASIGASDPDGTGVTFSIVGGADASRFAIDAVTGALRYVSAPDFEAPADAGGNNVYDVVVQASDGSLVDTQNLAISVGNVNEAPVITSGGGGSSAAYSVNENTTVVAAIVAGDPDGTSVTYSIVGGADAARFAINAATGALSFVSAPNFEAPSDVGANNVYDVVVQASDGSLIDTQALAVSVANVVDGQTINGTSSANTLTGTNAEDTINGLGGNDTITGGLGRDVLSGGAGNDTFVFSGLADSGVSNPDMILDFGTGNDKIGLSGIDARTNAAGDQAFTWIGTGSFTGVAGQLRYYQAGGDTFVSGDVNGDAVGDFLIQIDPLLTLTASNFVL